MYRRSLVTFADTREQLDTLLSRGLEVFLEELGISGDKFDKPIGIEFFIEEDSPENWDLLEEDG